MKKRLTKEERKALKAITNEFTLTYSEWKSLTDIPYSLRPFLPALIEKGWIGTEKRAFFNSGGKQVTEAEICYCLLF
jgi:hypothetical protein